MLESIFDSDLKVIVRWHAVGAAACATAAAVLGLLVVVVLAVPLDPPTAILGIGRMSAAARHLLLLGAVTPALSAALLHISYPDVSGKFSSRPAVAAIGVWDGAVLLGLLAILLGETAPDPWLPAPTAVRVLLWLGAAIWAWLVWGGASRRDGPLPVAAWFAAAATAGLVVYLTVALLSAGLGGASQALSAALAGRGLVLVWAAMAGFGVAAAVLPTAAEAPLYGRRVLLAGFVAWMMLAPLAAASPLLPDLVPAWLAPIVTIAGWLMLVPTILLAVGLLGAFVGSDVRRIDSTSGFVVAGVLILTAGVLVESASVAASGDAVRFTAWDPTASIVPTYPGLLLIGAGAVYWLLGIDDRTVVPLKPRLHLTIAIAAVLLALAPIWPLGLAEAGSGAARWLSGAAGTLLPTAFRFRLPGSVMLLAAAAAWLANVLKAPTEREAEPRSLPETADGVAAAISVPVLLGITTVAFALGLMATLFLPLADPGAVAPTGRSLARDFESDGLRGSGRSVYTAEGCLGCHTQRVREGPLDAAYGPATQRGDYGSGPAMAGQRRVGPDLAWVGNRFASRVDLADRMLIHGAGGTPAYPWLFGPDGPTPRGEAVVDYLIDLRSDGPGW